EAGHVLGLSHSAVPGATMMAGNSARTLLSDDEDSLCAVGAPDRGPDTASCDPKNGLSTACGGALGVRRIAHPPPTGCQLSSRGGSGVPELAISLPALVAFFLRRRFPR